MQVFAIHVFHGNVRKPFYFADVVHAANIRMRDLSRDSHLIVKARLKPGISRDFGWQELEGHLLAEPQVRSPIYFTHSSHAQQTDNPIAIAKQRSGNEAALFTGAGTGAG